MLVLANASAALATNNPPDTPELISPVNGTTWVGVTPLLRASEFSDPEGDSPGGCHWQIDTCSEFSNPVFNFSGDHIWFFATQITVPPETLSHETTYFWRVRYQDGPGAWSNWPAPSQFTTGPPPNQSPDAPIPIGLTSGAKFVGVTPTLLASEFSDPDGDSHANSQWQVGTSVGFVIPLWDSGEDSPPSTEHTVPDGWLSYGFKHYWRVRYKDSRGAWSSWSVPQAFDPGVYADLDDDGDVDQEDFGLLQVCLGRNDPPCEVALISSGSVVGERDINLLRRCMSGTGIPAEPSCLRSEPPGPDGKVIIPAGEFLMGDAFNEGQANELPRHAVHVSDFCVDLYPVTNQQYVDALNWVLDQSYFYWRPFEVVDGVVCSSIFPDATIYCSTTSDPDLGLHSQITWNGYSFGVLPGKAHYPMVAVTWYGALRYCHWRSAMEGLPGCSLYGPPCYANGGYRLPTEAEWEKAARGGVAGRRFPWADVDHIQHTRANYYSLPDYAYDDSPTRGYHPMFLSDSMPFTSWRGALPANDYGLHDMAGNIWEWCSDCFDEDYYGSSPYEDPTGPSTSCTHRVLRGGSWAGSADECRVAFRGHGLATNRNYTIGFRCVKGL